MKKENLHGENTITNEHIKSNKRVRGILVESGIVPEKLPPEEDIQQLQKRVKDEEKNIAESSKRKTQKRLE